MSRAAKSRQQSNKKRSGRGNTFIGVFVGLVIGVLIAAALAWYFSRPYEFQQKGVNPPPSGVNGKPIALPGKPGDKPVERPEGVPPVATAPATPANGASAPAKGDEKRFDFYDILQKGEQATLPPPAKSQSEPKVAGDKLYLQLGAFADPSEADNLKARLALTGTEASVQRVDTADKGTLYRVRVGPYAKPEEMSSARAQLAAVGIDSTVIKIRNKDATASAAAPR
jgi:cell division protein FtsN